MPPRYLYTMPMFSLTESLIEEISFAMEDQAARSLIELESGRILSLGGESDCLEELADAEPGADFSEAGGWASLPEWKSADGFRLMSEFAQSIEESGASAKLTAALNRHKGVFRAFKDVLSEFPGLEQRYFAYKDSALRRLIRLWYAELAGGLGSELRDLGSEDLASGKIELCDLSPAQAESLLDRFFADAEGSALCLPQIPASLRAVILSSLRSFLGSGASCLAARVSALSEELYAGLVLYRPLGVANAAQVGFLGVFPEYIVTNTENILLDALRARGHSTLLIQRMGLGQRASESKPSLALYHLGLLEAELVEPGDS